MLKLGINLDVSNKEYHDDREYISSSGIKKLFHDELAYEDEYINGNKVSKQSNGLDEGTVTHTAILEPHLYDSTVAIYPEFTKAGNKFHNFQLANPGKIILSQSQEMRIKNLLKAYNSRPEAVNMINESEKEFTLCDIINDVKVKIRCDAININKGYIADIKTTGYTAEYETFKANAYSKMLSYDISAALYCQVAEQIYGKPFDFYYIVLSKQDYTCEIYKSSEQSNINGRLKIVKALEKLKYFREHGKWPKQKIETSRKHSNYEIKEL